MTYRNNGSYLRFQNVSIPKKNINKSNKLMNHVISSEKEKHHLQDCPGITKTQNVFSVID